MNSSFFSSEENSQPAYKINVFDGCSPLSSHLDDTRFRIQKSTYESTTKALKHLKQDSLTFKDSGSVNKSLNEGISESNSNSIHGKEVKQAYTDFLRCSSSKLQKIRDRLRSVRNELIRHKSNGENDEKIFPQDVLLRIKKELQQATESLFTETSSEDRPHQTPHFPHSSDPSDLSDHATPNMDFCKYEALCSRIQHNITKTTHVLLDLRANMEEYLKQGGIGNSQWLVDDTRKLHVKTHTKYLEKSEDFIGNEP
ncbi:hypothetical protein CRM22_009316 [Opisthorchis felineus]|uniref:Uncharacterized protein n=1 Tax=Opisthorchis felineus TaxID=147828 RepID=A0A4S2L7X7_OPIFE|nr:hypothetical protein CRM22_009316 [Opisthorchis felineus]